MTNALVAFHVDWQTLTPEETARVVGGNKAIDDLNRDALTALTRGNPFWDFIEHNEIRFVHTKVWNTVKLLSLSDDKLVAAKLFLVGSPDVLSTGSHVDTIVTL